jgi:hypothetical protein
MKSATYGTTNKQTTTLNLTAVNFNVPAGSIVCGIHRYLMINSTKSPATGVGNLNESRLMSQGTNFAKSYAPRLPKEVMKWRPPRRRKRGKPKLTWAEGIRGLMGEKGLMEEDWNDRNDWKKKII